jgi:hypothetical protein
MKLTQKQLEAIRQRVEKATPGPWKYSEGVGSYPATILSEKGEVVAAGDEYYGMTENDANFIAHARTDIPALLDHIAEVETERDEYLKRYVWLLEYVGKEKALEIFRSKTEKGEDDQ